MQFKGNWNSYKEEQEMEQKNGLRWCGFGEILTLTCGRWIFCVPSALPLLWQEESKETHAVYWLETGVRDNPSRIHPLVKTDCDVMWNMYKANNEEFVSLFLNLAANNRLHLTNWWRWNRQVKLWKNRRIKLSHCALSRSCFFNFFFFFLI